MIHGPAALELRRLRGEAVGLVFQDPMTRLNPLMTIGEHLADTLRNTVRPGSKRKSGAGPIPAAAGRDFRGALPQLPP